MKSRKILVIALSILAVFAILFLFLQGTRPVTKKPDTFPALNIPNTFRGGLTYKFNISEDDFDFPKEISVLNNRPRRPLEESFVTEIARNLGFTTSPIISNDVFDGTTFIWNGDEAYVTAWANSQKIEYSKTSEIGAINKQLTDTELQNIALGFLNNFKVDIQNLTFASFVYLKNNPVSEDLEQVDRNSATIYQLNYFPANIETPIITLDPKSTPIYVWILPDGSVYKTSVTFLGDIIPSESKYPIKNWEEFRNQINGAIIVSLDHGNMDPKDIGDSSVEISLDKVEIAYLMNSPTADIFQPIFLLTGNASIPGINEPISVVLYLPAIATNQP